MRILLLLCLFLHTTIFGNFSLKYPEETISAEIADYNEFTEHTIRGPSWVAYYGEKVPPSHLYGYNPLVLFPGHHPILAPLLVKGKTLLAYLSLADTHPKDFYHKSTKKGKLTLEKNPADPKRLVVDIRDPKWEELLLGTIIPEILAEGFNGFCLCNLDAALNLEQKNPEKYHGMTAAALNLIAKIHELYGEYQIMIDMHGLLHIGEQLLPYADMLLYEHLYTKKIGKELAINSTQNYLLTAQALHALAEKKQGLTVYTLDFWPAKESALIKQIYAKQRSYQFVPYIADSLERITPEP